MYHRFIIPKNDLHPSNSLQDMKQNHWTVECRSCPPWPHYTQVKVIRSTNVWPTIFINCLNNSKAEKSFLIWPLTPPWGLDPRIQSCGLKAYHPGYPYSKNECFLMRGNAKTWPSENFAHKTVPQHNADEDNQDPLYCRAKNYCNYTKVWTMSQLLP